MSISRHHPLVSSPTEPAGGLMHARPTARCHVLAAADTLTGDNSRAAQTHQYARHTLAGTSVGVFL